MMIKISAYHLLRLLREFEFLYLSKIGGRKKGNEEFFFEEIPSTYRIRNEICKKLSKVTGFPGENVFFQFYGHSNKIKGVYQLPTKQAVYSGFCQWIGSNFAQFELPNLITDWQSFLNYFSWNSFRAKYSTGLAHVEENCKINSYMDISNSFLNDVDWYIRYDILCRNNKKNYNQQFELSFKIEEFRLLLSLERPEWVIQKINQSILDYENKKEIFIKYDVVLSNAYFHLGFALENLDRLSEAADAYQKAVQANEKNGAAWSYLGIIFEMLGDTYLEDEKLKVRLKAERAYKNGIALFHLPSYYNIANLYNKMRKHEEAFQVIEAGRTLLSLPMNSNFGSFYFASMRAHSLAKLGRVAEALVEVENVSIETTDTDVFFDLSVVFGISGQKSKMFENLQTAYYLDVKKTSREIYMEAAFDNYRVEIENFFIELENNRRS